MKWSAEAKAKQSLAVYAKKQKQHRKGSAIGTQNFRFAQKALTLFTKREP